MPDGGILFQHGTMYENRLMRYNASGLLVYNVDILSMTGYSQVWVAWPQVDANGNVVVVRSGVNASSDRHTLVDVVSPTGTMQRVWDTLGLNTAATGEVFRYTQGERFATHIGELYVPICAGTCSASNPVMIYKVSIAGLGYDYPRSSWIAAQPAQLNYVALGDSFSSGEGVPPFLPPSDTNGCDRATRAYAMLLDQDPELSLNLKTLLSFTACAGATTETLVSGQSTNGNQLDAITADTDVVTLTVGGNDVGFVDYATACFWGDCSQTTAAFQTIQDKINNILPSRLSGLLDSIQGRLAEVGSTAQVYVVGYPRMMPYDDGTWPNCSYLPQDDRAAIRLVTTNLNTKVAQAVGAKGYPFVFVDADLVLDSLRVSPFANHELCSSDGYFNGIVVPTGYSFHPNAQGQQAYATLIKRYLQNPHA